MLKVFCAGIALVLAGCGAASALPLAPQQQGQAHIVLVAGGCGPALHRDQFGGCVPNRRVVVVGPTVVAPLRLPPPCPRGYVRDPDPARPICYPRF